MTSTMPTNTEKPASSPIRVSTLSKSPVLSRLEVEKSSVSKLPAKVQKQRINSLKQEQELALRELAAPAVAAVLAKALEMALGGDKHMIRLILELHMSKPQAQEDQSGGRSAINIQINNLTKKPTHVATEVIDVQSASTRSDGHSEEHAEVHSDGPEAGADHGEQ